MNKDQKLELLSIFDKEESKLIENFRQHLVFHKINEIPEKDFLVILIQRMFLSLTITPVYELAINMISDKNAIATIREILHEEYPRDSNGNPLPSHRELLMKDLIELGASKDFINTQPIFENTKDVICSALKMLFNQDQIGIIAFIRFWGEILVSEEYSCFWPRMENKLSENGENEKKKSLFYWYHMKHDEKKRSLTENNILESYSHSEKLADHLKFMIKSENDIRYCLTVEEEAQRMKLNFYDQFFYLF